MTLADIAALENAGRSTMVWVPEPDQPGSRLPALTGIAASALGFFAVAGMLLAYVIWRRRNWRFEP